MIMGELFHLGHADANPLVSLKFGSSKVANALIIKSPAG